MSVQMPGIGLGFHIDSTCRARSGLAKSYYIPDVEGGRMNIRDQKANLGRDVQSWPETTRERPVDLAVQAEKRFQIRFCLFMRYLLGKF